MYTSVASESDESNSTHRRIKKKSFFGQLIRIALNYSILYQKLGGHTVLGHTVIALHTVTVLGTHGYLVGSGEK